MGDVLYDWSSYLPYPEEEIETDLAKLEDTVNDEGTRNQSSSDKNDVLSPEPLKPAPLKRLIASNPFEASYVEELDRDLDEITLESLSFEVIPQEIIDTATVCKGKIYKIQNTIQSENYSFYKYVVESATKCVYFQHNSIAKKLIHKGSRDYLFVCFLAVLQIFGGHRQNG